ncbi:kinase [Virgibacillus ndiopensis]|uniref:kinase n=1 Tax=Virgibacillus ndiopensis TaxID=2004408 RepID=UPI000C086388|nr:kinase [Virgibacillus ndiopensis]
MKDNLEALIRVIPTIEEGRRFILGVDGLSRSGKTTIVNKLKKILRDENNTVYVFHIDDHIVERKKRYHTEHEEWFEYYYLQWDINWLRDNFFTKLRYSNDLNLPFYDGDSDVCTMVNVKPPDSSIIIIEGVFLQRQEWRDFYDYVVYLDSPRDKRFQRESNHTQKAIEKFKNRYWKAEEFYIQSESPKKNADLVLNG